MKKDYRFYVYIVANFNRTVFYTGISNSLIRRTIEHKYGLGSKFTKKYHVKHLVYFESYKYINDAITREKELKKWRREKKINLIKTTNPEMKDLSEQLFEDYGISKEEVLEYIGELKNKNSF